MKQRSHIKESAARLLIQCAVALAAVLPGFSSAAATGYYIIDLGTLGGTFTNSRANAINNAGQVVGDAANNPLFTWSFSAGRAWVWDSVRGMRNLGALAGLEHYCHASDINESGMAVGYSHSATGLVSHAFVWTEASGLTDLGAYLNQPTIATGVDDSGDVVGWAGVTVVGAGSFYWGFRWNGSGPLTGIPEFHFDFVRAINDAGQIVGQTGVSSSSLHAVLLDPVTGGRALETLGSHPRSDALDINEAGQVVGYVWGSGTNVMAARWADGDVRPLSLPGFLNAKANAINNAGQIVGLAYDGNSSDLAEMNGSSSAALWQDGMVINLNDLIDTPPGWKLVSARDINDQGDIVGQAQLNTESGSSMHAYLLTRNPPLPPLSTRRDGNELVLEWAEGAIPVVLQFSHTVVNGGSWSDMLDTSDRESGEHIEHREMMQGNQGFFRLIPSFDAPSAITSR